MDAPNAFSAPNTDLPLELILFIIDLLGNELESKAYNFESCILALRSLSLASRVYTSACQDHLFRKISLDRSNIMRFSEVALPVVKNPECPILSRIRDLSITSWLTTESNDVQEHTVVEALARLNRKNVRTFLCRYEHPLQLQRTMDVDFRMAIYWFIKRNPITKLGFENIGNLYPPFLLCAPALKSLCLQSCTVDKDWEWVDASENTIKLKNIELDITDIATFQNMKCLDRSTVRNIRICSFHGRTSETERLQSLLCSIDRLEGLDIDTTDFDRASMSDILVPPPGNEPSLILSHPLEFLRSLIITVRVRNTVWRTADFPPFADIDKDLKRISGANHLEEVVLKLMFPHRGRGGQLDLNPASWMAIRDTFELGFPKLRKIGLSIEFMKSEEDAERLEQRIDGLMQGSLSWARDRHPTLETVTSVIIPRPTPTIDLPRQEDIFEVDPRPYIGFESLNF